MSRIKELLEKIEAHRELMYYEIQERVELFAPEVVLISQEIDLLLNQYHRLITLKKSLS